jgi:hypothetical protein
MTVAWVSGGDAAGKPDEEVASMTGLALAYPHSVTDASSRAPSPAGSSGCPRGGPAYHPHSAE